MVENAARAGLLTVSRRLLLRLELVYCFLLYLIPLVLSGPQLLVGSIVNAALFAATLKLSKQSLFLLAVLPSLGAFSHGVLFGPLSWFLFYFLPFIWAGNLILIGVFRQTRVLPAAWARIVLAAALKALLLFAAANFYYRWQIAPKPFITAMGLVQFETALIGGFSVWALVGLKRLRTNERSK